MTVGVSIGEKWGDDVFDLVRGTIDARWIVVHYSTQAGWSMVTPQFKLTYLFLLNWSRKIPSDVFSEIETVNFHCTPLPYGRGGAPIENMILRGHDATVITAHRVIEEFDAGPIYARSEPISLYGTKDEIRGRFVEPISRMIQNIVTHRPEPTAQVGEPVCFKRLSEDEMVRFWEARRDAIRH